MNATIRSSLRTTLSRTEFRFRDVLLNGIQILCVLSWLAQLAVDPSADNMTAVSLVVVSTSVLIQYLRMSPAMSTHPLSSFAMLGFSGSSQFIALFVQSSELTPFTQYLRAPILTFTILAVAHLSIVLAHFVYRNFTPFSGASIFISRKIYAPLNMHRIPRPIALWIYSFFGLAAIIFGGGAAGDVSGKFLAGFVPFMWAPLLIPLYVALLGDEYCNRKTQFTLVALYTIPLMAIALIKNFRAMLFLAPVQITFLLVIFYSQRNISVSRKGLIRTVIVCVVIAAFLPTLSDVVTAMEIARADRDKASPMEMISKTKEAFLDKNQLRKYRDQGMLSIFTQTYDERYLANPLFGRLTETKFHDNMIYFGSEFNESDREQVIDDQINKTIAIVPQNILDALDAKFDKDKYIYSTGDFYLSIANGSSLGGFATGSLWADLYVIFGAWLPFVIFLLMTPVFILMDALCNLDAGMFICPAQLCAMWHLYLYGIGSESISAKINQITRGSLQELFLYSLLAFSVAWVLQLFRLKAFIPLSPSPSTTGRVLATN